MVDEAGVRAARVVLAVEQGYAGEWSKLDLLGDSACCGG